MTLYRVDLVQTVIEETTIYIEASNPADAADYAMTKVLHDAADIRWDFCDSKDDPEIIDVEPVVSLHREGADEQTAQHDRN